MKARNLIFAGFVFAAASGFAQAPINSVRFTSISSPARPWRRSSPMPWRRARRTSRSPAIPRARSVARADDEWNISFALLALLSK